MYAREFRGDVLNEEPKELALTGEPSQMIDSNDSKSEICITTGMYRRSVFFFFF